MTFKPHSSLNAPLIELRDRSAPRTMAVNAPCWCGSGRKWKRCHRDRDLQPPVNVWEHVARMRERFLKGHCCHPIAGVNTCGGPPVQAHSVQRNGGLGAIAEDGHVLSIKAAYQDLRKNGGKLIPRKMGVRTASTFFGFCSRHDAEMFRPVEYGTVGITNENCFLLSFRALAYEVIMKHCALSLMPLHR